MLGSVLDFIEKGRILSAVVVGQKGTHYQVLTENAREMTLGLKRILNPSADGLDPKSPRPELVRRVKEMSQRREEQKGRVDARELWELLLGEGASFDAGYLSELAFGDRDPDHVSATFRALFEEKTYFRLSQDRFVINTPEQVERIIEARERERQRESLLADGAAWLKAVASGAAAPPAPAEAAEAIELLKGEAVWGRDFPRHRDAAELLTRAGLNRPEAAFELLVALGVFSPDENLDLIRLEIPVEFEPAVHAEADSLVAAGCALGPGGRLDLRGLWTATIDGPATRDYDDALSVEQTGEGLRVGIHVADVGGCIAPGSRLWREALERAASIYLPEGRIPMLPPSLSEELCSLKAGEDRPTLSVLARLGQEGEVLDFELARSQIRVAEQLTYEQVDQSADERLGWLMDAAEKLRRRRVEAGALLLPIPEIQIRLGEGEIAIRRLDTDSASRRLVSEMMILANWLIARALSEGGVPAIYRSQGEPRERLTRDGEEELFILLRQCRLLSRAEWSSQPRPHASLGLPVYTSATSPIRRAVDLLVQRQVAALLGEGEPQSEDELLASLSRIEEAQRRKAAFEQRRVRYWLLKYLEAHVGERLEALVLAQWPRRFQVVLLDLLIEADLPLGGAVAVGQRIGVRIERADARRDILQVAL